MAKFLSLLLFLSLTSPAYAQLAGSDTAPGDSCAGMPTGATRVVADPDGDGTQVTLICDGSNWLQEGIVVLSKAGDPPTADGGSVTPAGNDGEIQFNDATTALGASSDLFWDDSNSYLGIGTNTPAAELHVVGDIHYTGVMQDVSDRRAKDNIQPLGDALEKIKHLNGVSFVMKDDPKQVTELGLIAQDVEKVYPELVSVNPNGLRGLNYQGLIGPMVEAIKELDAENRALKARLYDMDRRLQVLEGTRRPHLKAYND